MNKNRSNEKNTAIRILVIISALKCSNGDRPTGITANNA
jgi:hypothetical protein